MIHCLLFSNAQEAYLLQNQLYFQLILVEVLQGNKELTHYKSNVVKREEKKNQNHEAMLVVK